MIDIKVELALVHTPLTQGISSHKKNLISKFYLPNQLKSPRFNDDSHFQETYCHRKQYESR